MGNQRGRGLSLIVRILMCLIMAAGVVGCEDKHTIDADEKPA
jgi:hypothetical protein